jgi:hypothetical protein
MSALAMLGPILGQDSEDSALPEPARIIARYQEGNDSRAITRGDVALEMAFHQRRLDSGRAAVEHLVNTTLVRQAAEENGLWPSDADVQALWDEIERQLRASGRKPEDIPVIRNTGPEGFLADLALQLAHEQLVRRQLELGRDESVGGEMLQLWIVEARKRTPIVDDPAQLPAGVAARVAGKDIPQIQLGMLLLRLADEQEQTKFIRQVVVLERIEHAAREAGLMVTEEDVEHELAARQAAAEKDPRYKGMAFEELLESQGISVDWLRQGRVFRGQLLQKKLAARQLPRKMLLEEIERDRQTVLEKAGPRRRVGMIYVRALAEPNALIPRDFTAAMTHLRDVRQRLDTEKFDVVARIESEEPNSKMRGGDIGWLQRNDDRLASSLVDAVFALDRDQVSQPLQAEDGCYLFKVLDIEPDPSNDELIVRLREQRIEELTQELLDGARITRPDGTPLTR